MIGLKKKCIAGFGALLLISTIIAGKEKDVLNLVAIAPIEPPVIINKTVTINIYLVFDDYPANYWLHYNKKTKRLVFEFIGSSLGDSLPPVHSTDIISDLKVENQRTEFALNRKISRLSMCMRDGWHFEAINDGNLAIKLRLWTKLNTAKNLDKKGNEHLAGPIIISEIAVGVLLLFFLFDPFDIRN